MLVIELGFSMQCKELGWDRPHPATETTCSSQFREKVMPILYIWKCFRYGTNEEREPTEPRSLKQEASAFCIVEYRLCRKEPKRSHGDSLTDQQISTNAGEGTAFPGIVHKRIGTTN